MNPDTLIAELTYACALKCGYCSNPISYPRATLSTAEWCRVLGEANGLGVLQVHFTGGEPLLRDDLEALIAAARAESLYTNLITSGVPLDEKRLERLAAAGLDHLQLSFQAATAADNDAIAGTPSFAQKVAVARWWKALDLPLTLNVVIHRANIDDIPRLVALAEALDADRLELANAQYLGWALRHRAALLPTAAELARARLVVARERRRLRGAMDVVFVMPDYFTGRPRACMAGWARRYMVIAPDGKVLPCQAAMSIEGLSWERAGERPLAEIWRDSPSLQRFRGENWMAEPCRDCNERTRDFGGCRCQAFALTGDAGATDPACNKSARHLLVRRAPRDGASGHRHLRLF